MTTTQEMAVRRAVAVVLLAGIMVAGTNAAQAQQPYLVDAIRTWVWQPESIQLVPIYQGNYWHWTPELGWHQERQWAYVLRRIPGRYVERTVMLDVFSK